MHKLLFGVLLPSFVVTACVGCSGSFGGPGDDSPEDSPDPASDNQNIVDGTLSGSVTGTIDDVEAFLEVLTVDDQSTAEFSLEVDLGWGLTITAPSEWADPNNEANFSLYLVWFDGAPYVGSHTETDADACGGMDLYLASNSDFKIYYSYNYSSCGSDAYLPVGAYTLTLSSVVLDWIVSEDGDSLSAYTVHGSLTGTMNAYNDDGGDSTTDTADTVDIDLSF